MTHLKVKSDSKNDIPWSLFEPKQTTDKCFAFEETIDNYKEICYNINEHRFRHNVDYSKKIIVFCGCSLTFGTGLAEEDTYPHLVTGHLGNDYDYINISMPSTGPDIQMLNLSWALNNFNVEKIFWYMSDPHRQVVLPDNENVGLYIPSHYHNEWFDHGIGKKFKEVNLELEDTWRLKTYWNLYSLFSLIKHKNIETYVTCWDLVLDTELEKLRNLFGFNSLGNLNITDLARDNAHPGIDSHRQFAENILKRIQS
jgi:hypothetical protein